MADLASWTNRCAAEHKSCARPAHQLQMPTRLLDVFGGSVKLSEHFGSEFQDYIALSHCWGKAQPLRTLSTNIAQHRDDIPIASLPKTFLDSIDVARYLGVRFVWIDSLCIIQDSKDDWEHESSRMADVYGCSYLTILATASEDGRGGLFRRAQIGRKIQYELKDLRHDLSTRVFVRESLPHAPFNRLRIDLGDPPLPLLERSWCFQGIREQSQFCYMANVV